MNPSLRSAAFAAAMLVSAAAWADCDDSHKASWAATAPPTTAQVTCDRTDCKAPAERSATKSTTSKDEREGVRNGAKPAKAPASKPTTTVALSEPAARK
jgi:hypothetical protein